MYRFRFAVAFLVQCRFRSCPTQCHQHRCYCCRYSSHHCLHFLLCYPHYQHSLWNCLDFHLEYCCYYRCFRSYWYCLERCCCPCFRSYLGYLSRHLSLCCRRLCHWSLLSFCCHRRQYLGCRRLCYCCHCCRLRVICPPPPWTCLAPLWNKIILLKDAHIRST